MIGIFPRRPAAMNLNTFYRDVLPDCTGKPLQDALRLFSLRFVLSVYLLSYRSVHEQQGSSEAWINGRSARFCPATIAPIAGMLT